MSRTSVPDQGLQMNLRERAAAAHAEQVRAFKAEEARREAERTARQCEQLRDALARYFELEIPLPAEPRVTIDGITFVPYGYGVAIVGTCPRCGEQTTGEEIRDWAELGRQLAGAFTASTDHRWDYCHPPTTTAAPAPALPSPAERLVDALIDALHERGLGE